MGLTRENAAAWKGGRSITPLGYVQIYRPEHPKARDNGYVFEHTLIAEQVLGKPLPAKAQVHHVDDNGTNNSHRNLVLCEDDAYHKLLHARARVIRAGGIIGSDKICCRCQTLKPLGAFSPDPNAAWGVHGYCRKCGATRRKEKRDGTIRATA